MIPHFLPAWQDEWHCPGERQTATSPWCMGSGHTSRAARMCSLHTNVHVLEAATAIPRRNIDTGPRIQDPGSRILLISACPWPPAGPPRSPGAWILASLHVGMYAGASVRRVQTIADEPQLPVGQTLRYVGGGSAASDMDRTRSFPTSWRQIVFDASAHCTCCICCSLLLFRRIMCHWLIAQRPTHSLFQRPLPKYMGPRTLSYYLTLAPPPPTSQLFSSDKPSSPNSDVYIVQQLPKQPASKLCLSIASLLPLARPRQGSSQLGKFHIYFRLASPPPPPIHKPGNFARAGPRFPTVKRFTQDILCFGCFFVRGGQSVRVSNVDPVDRHSLKGDPFSSSAPTS